MKYLFTILNIFAFYLFGHGQNKTIHVSNYTGSRIEIKSSGEKPLGIYNTALSCVDLKTRDSIGNYQLFINGVKIDNGYGHSTRLFLSRGKTSISVSADGYKTAVIKDKYLNGEAITQIKVSLLKDTK